jgi:hypothetical protein
MSSFSRMEIASSIDKDENGKVLKLLRRYRFLGILLIPLFFFATIFSGGFGKNVKSNHVCHQECTIRRNERYKLFKGQDLLVQKDLLKAVTDEKELLIDRLKIDYGEENFYKIFMKDDGTARPFVPFDDESPERLKRKLMIKVLSAQKELKRKESTFNGCDCINGDKGIPHDPAVVQRKDGEGFEIGYPPVETSFEKYVWATGGHSASAAHGNLYNESYTAFMERDVKDIFGSIGIDFEGRNYAMGGTSSAPEVSMCWNEIFGDDVDFFSWDYGMTDAGYPYKMVHYAYRGAISKGRPAFLGIRFGQDDERETAMRVLGEYGMTTFIQEDGGYAKMREGVPDTFGLNTNEINAMPEYVRNFRCDGLYEKGEPFCEDEKYSSEICKDRAGKAPWHPGIKSHAMVGHSLALFLVENLQSALEGLIELEAENTESLLARLLQEEDELFEGHLTKGDFQDLAKKTFLPDHDDEEKLEEDVTFFFTGKSMCHTARTPARTRYLGFLTNTDKVGGPAPVGRETYDVGIEDKNAPKDGDEMLLVWTDADLHQQDCPVTVSPDYKDSFLAHGSGWNALVFPNEAERKAYGYKPSELHGVIAVAFTSCDWDRCEKGYLGWKDFGGEENKWEMKVNGVPVESLVSVGKYVYVLRGENGINFSPSSTDDYKFEIKVNTESGYVKISSFIVH